MGLHMSLHYSSHSGIPASGVWTYRTLPRARASTILSWLLYGNWLSTPTRLHRQACGWIRVGDVRSFIVSGLIADWPGGGLYGSGSGDAGQGYSYS